MSILKDQLNKDLRKLFEEEDKSEEPEIYKGHSSYSYGKIKKILFSNSNIISK